MHATISSLQHQIGPLAAYRARVTAKELATDPAQAAAAERLVHHELEGQDVGGLIPIDRPPDQRTEVSLYHLGSDHLAQRVVGRFVVGEERHVTDVALVAAPGPTQVD